MAHSPNPSPDLDRAQLKLDIAEAIRSVIRERADELGITYEACIDLLLKRNTETGPS